MELGDANTVHIPKPTRGHLKHRIGLEGRGKRRRVDGQRTGTKLLLLPSVHAAASVDTSVLVPPSPDSVSVGNNDGSEDRGRVGAMQSGSAGGLSLEREEDRLGAPFSSVSRPVRCQTPAAERPPRVQKGGPPRDSGLEPSGGVVSVVPRQEACHFVLSKPPRVVEIRSNVLCHLWVGTLTHLTALTDATDRTGVHAPPDELARAGVADGVGAGKRRRFGVLSQVHNFEAHRTRLTLWLLRRHSAERHGC